MALADVVFAVDSVPAILAITTDTFVVFAANAFALLGLRALFFLVAGAVARFAYLQLGLGVLLIGIAGKLVYGEVTGEKVPTLVTLGAIVVIVGAAIGASLLRGDGGGERAAGGPAAEPQAQLLVDRGVVQQVEVVEPAQLVAVVDLERDAAPAAVAAPRRARHAHEQVAEQRPSGPGLSVAPMK